MAGRRQEQSIRNAEGNDRLAALEEAETEKVREDVEEKVGVDVVMI